MTPFRRLLASVAGFVAAVALSACGGGALPSDEGNLRLVNATTDFASLDLFQTNSAFVTGVTSLSASAFGGIKNGNYAIDVRATGSATALATGNVSLGKKDFQTVVAYSNAGSLALQVLSDKEGDPSSGNAKIRIFNAASGDTGGLDVYLTTGDCASLAGSSPFAANLSGLQTSFTQVTASTTPYHLCVTTPGDKTELRLDIASLVLSNQRIVTIVLSRSAGGFLVNGMTIDQQGAVAQTVGGSARVRVVADQPSTSPALDVTVNDKAVAAGLASPNVAPYVVVPAGALTIKINGTAYTASTISVAAGSDATLLVSGTTPVVTKVDDDNSLSQSSTRPVKVRIVNGLTNTTASATLTVDNAVLGTAAPLAGSSYSLLAPSAALSKVEARLGATTVYSTTGVTFSSGHVYSLFVLGDAGTAAGVLIADR